ncbi:MAG TPA: sigma 54-interacting transcriptional regulator, partial [Polyangiaceae bacterium]|nr:sigma 54-interacting transcriptional regulator [Polyangiaceae bacterium]
MESDDREDDRRDGREAEPTSSEHWTAGAPPTLGLGVVDAEVAASIRRLGGERGFKVVDVGAGADAAALRSYGALVIDALTAARLPPLASFFDIAAPIGCDFLLLRMRTDDDCAVEAYAYARARLDRMQRTLEALFPGDKPPRDAADEILGNAPEIRLVRRQVRRIATYPDVSVLILGETGTGKELVARAIHDLSAPDEACVALNCAAISESLFESELFGHERGAYTGAHAARVGLLEQAGAGTVFLDEVGEMPVHLQPKLLRALETRSFRRVGGGRDVPLRARIVSATNRTLSRKNHNVLRSDLMFRLAGFTVAIPPLRARLGDMVSLAQRFLREFLERHARSRPLGFTSAAVGELSRHSWPGNVRELRAVVEQAAILASGAMIEGYDIQACLNE